VGGGQNPLFVLKKGFFKAFRDQLALGRQRGTVLEFVEPIEVKIR
jgi:hypothetical protein